MCFIVKKSIKFKYSSNKLCRPRFSFLITSATLIKLYRYVMFLCFTSKKHISSHSFHASPNIHFIFFNNLSSIYIYIYIIHSQNLDIHLPRPPKSPFPLTFFSFINNTFILIFFSLSSQSYPQLYTWELSKISANLTFLQIQPKFFKLKI